MNLGDYLTEACVHTNVEMKSKDALLQFIASEFDKAGILESQPVSQSEILKALQKREAAQSTGLGDGIAIPHARIAGFHGMAVAILTSKSGIEFDALDNKPVHVVWAILVAEDEPTLALQAYAKIQELMQDQAIRVFFQHADSSATLCDYLKQKEIPVGDHLTARHIMRTPTTHVTPEMPLHEVVHQMRLQHIEAVPVEDETRAILGEITCDHLFQYGIPDFFNQLQSVGFISRFDPFEKYFNEEGKCTAHDVMHKDFATVSPDATMMEVVFELTVKRHTKVYVVENGVRVGTIDRPEVLDRILDF